ncbi:MAG TPA: outer membrane lipoprotein-sorting protein [Flavobacteriaceae bacterium]|nr:outer membrane lipoprotein-sorting protein [Flavobacteriaceae bacterium]MCB9213210.1 outer membrane lipoprotein-sorting protein [Alteromonas sp.]HPF10118.1 outer membrane lipoprotein-sorting protein [Flavobacteriaceae bacterium]HQU22239.1 outer membrane lipoprotein-sorting protein [Flavobacteriaceae bacterium]HQU66120.1 outer membrane lipoprotein-sorting protein [Flavobacteriaceae bacterium]
MKTLKFISMGVLFLLGTLVIKAQTADEIISNFIENTGGLDAWKSLKALKFEGNVDIGQGITIPIEVISTNDGKTMIKANFQGQNFYQTVYDGETLWGTNQMTMQAEKSDAEATANYKNEANDFPDPFIDYKEKGYTVELIGNETIEGTDTYKIKLVKEPVMVDGKEEQDISFYYFDTENFVPIVVETEINSGPAAGMVSQTKLSDYQEVDGLYFAFSIVDGIKGQPGGQGVTITSISLNPEVDESIFAFPEPVSTGETKE